MNSNILTKLLSYYVWAVLTLTARLFKSVFPFYAKLLFVEISILAKVIKFKFLLMSYLFFSISSFDSYTAFEVVVSYDFVEVFSTESVFTF